MKKFEVTVKWTNWTFGFWYDNKKLHAWGVDLGPVELMYKMTYRKKYFGIDPKLWKPTIDKSSIPTLTKGNFLYRDKI